MSGWHCFMWQRSHLSVVLGWCKLRMFRVVRANSAREKVSDEKKDGYEMLLNWVLHSSTRCNIPPSMLLGAELFIFLPHRLRVWDDACIERRFLAPICLLIGGVSSSSDWLRSHECDASRRQKRHKLMEAVTRSRVSGLSELVAGRTIVAATQVCDFCANACDGSVNSIIEYAMRNGSSSAPL